MNIDLLGQLFPSELIEYFTITNVETCFDEDLKQEHLVVDFEEKNVLPDGYSALEYESKGFMGSKRIQDFPLRGKPVFLRIRKRRWRHKETGEVVKRDFTFMADGSKFTQELSDFLKDAGGYANRYHEQHSQLLRGEQ
ncbi:MAG: hypothetical protein RLZZ165_1600 [Bacteroidota bacterium]|jgi:hypothetical protein